MTQDIESTPSQPQDLSRNLDELANGLNGYLEYLGLPTESVIVETEQRKQAISNLPFIVSDLDADQKLAATYLSKFVAACAMGLFDAALNYLWDETVRNLREKVARFDLNYFYDSVITDPDRRSKFKDDSDLENLEDWRLISGCRETGIIGEIGFKHLDYIRDMRNHASAAHPNHNEITGLQLAAWLQTCVREVLGKEPEGAAFEVRRLLKSLREESLSASDVPHIGSAVERLPDGGSGIGGLLAGMGSLFALLPAALGNLWLLAHGLPVGFKDVPDLGSVPLIGEALEDVPLRFGLLGDWPFGWAWRLLLVAPIAGLVLGGVVAARGAAARPLQGALVAVPYTVITLLAAVLLGLDASVSVAALDVDLSFGASLAWMALLLPVAAGLGALGGLIGRPGAVPVPRPRRTTLVTGVVSAVVLLLTLPVALVPLSGGNAAPEVPVEDSPLADIGPETTTPPEPEETSSEPEPTGEPEPTAAVSPDAPPDPAFDALLPTLQESTAARIMLPAELPGELSNVAVDSDSGEDEYGILFLAEPTGNVVEDYVRAYDVGTIRSTPNPQEVSEEFFDASREETVELPDGTEATLRYLEPSTEGGNAGPFWEGRFEKDGQTYIVSVPLADSDGEIARGLLVSMVEVPGSEEASAEQQFISEYYAAVGREDWAATYSMLDAASQFEFTEEEWVSKQQARENASNAAPVESATIAEISGEGAGFTATVNLAYEDGTEATLPGVAVYFEDGEFKRHLTDEDLAFLEDF